ncbi:MAG: tyrosine-type recombinase/integrase [Acidimicrobiales bacterium]
MWTRAREQGEYAGETRRGYGRSGLLIRWFRVRAPGGAPRHTRSDALSEPALELSLSRCRESAGKGFGAMGTMRERSPGKWELVVSAGVNPATGRYHRVVRTVATKSKREAKAALATLESAVAAGNVSFDDPTLSSLLDRWMEHITSLGRADTTLYHYRQYIDREIVPVLGSIRLSRLKALDIDRLYGNLRKRGLAAATIRQVHAILRASLNQAERWGLVQLNVAKLASAPSPPQREQHPPTVEEVRALVQAAAELDAIFGLYIRVMVATGARRAEVCGLRWSDVDFEAGTLSVSRSYTVVPGVRGDRPTKTRSTRLVMLDPITLAGLRSGLAHSVGLAERFGFAAEIRRGGYVFTDDPGGTTAWRPDTANARWVKARLAVGLTSIRLHDLRQFQATQLLDAGVSVPTVAARLGHADGTTTMKIYAHRTRRADQQAADVVARLLE